MKKLEASLGRSEQAAVVRNRFVELLRQGKTGEEAVKELQSMTGDQKDTQFGREFWMALADIMWNYGRLTEQVKTNALRAIDSCRQVTMERRGSDRQYLLQMEYLSRLESKLQAPQPEQKKVATYQLFVNDWEPGDVLAYRLSGAAEAYAGQLVFVHVVRKQKYFPGHIVPVVRVFRLTASRNLELKELQAGGYLPQYWSPISIRPVCTTCCSTRCSVPSMRRNIRAFPKSACFRFWNCRSTGWTMPTNPPAACLRWRPCRRCGSGRIPMCIPCSSTADSGGTVMERS